MTAQVRRKRQRARADVSKFAALIASPAVAEFDMPANGRIRFVATAGATEGDIAATLGGAYRAFSEDEDGKIVQSTDTTPREIKTQELEEGGYVQVDQIERAVHVTLS